MLASTSYHPLPSAPSRVGQAGRLGGAARRCRAPCGARTRAQRPDSGSEGDCTTGGDPQVQDALVSELRTQIEIEKSFEAGKQQFEADVEEGKEVLRQVAEEAKAELDRLGELKRLQSELAFGSAIADFNQDLDAVEAELAERRAEMNAAQAELDAWEGGLPARRSAGHFFQSLYQNDTKKTPTGMNSEQLQERLDHVAEPAATEVGSRLRGALFGLLALALAGTAAADLAGGAPSPGQDALYLGLALLMATTAYSERAAFRRRP